MNIEEVKKTILTEEKYKPVRDHNAILLTLGGSYAYGTNVETSDIDVRGIVLDPVESLLGLSNFEQHEIHNEEIDTVLYGLKKMVKLLLGCNPNTIEILSPQERNIVTITDVGKKLIENRHIFLSQRAAFTFGAYAKAQLGRLENALCRGYMEQAKQEEHMLHSIQSAMHTFNTKYKDFEEGAINIYIDKGPQFEDELLLDVNLTKYPLRDYKAIWAEMNNIVKDYSKLNHRNKKRDIPHLNKHIVHLVRLYLMGIDILTNQEIITYRENDIDYLLAIRNGLFLDSDGKLSDKFYTEINKLKERFDSAAVHTKLPKKPDFNAAERFIINTYKEIY